MEAMTAILGGIVGGLVAIAYSEYRQRTARSGLRSQTIFLLRQLEIHMGMTRDYPEYYRGDIRIVLRRLEELSLTPLSATGLRPEERAAVFNAAYEGTTSNDFISDSIARNCGVGSGDREYLVAAARVAFRAAHAARNALADQSALTKPRDPRHLHNWHPGDTIPESDSW
jgi:hypothetical protein